MFLLSACAYHSQNSREFKEGIHTERFVPAKGRAFNYWLLSCREKTAGKKVPLLFIFHGTGGNGRAYLETWKKEAESRQWMVLSPDLDYAYGEQFAKLEDYTKLLEEVVRQYPVDNRKIYLGSVSSGALIARRLFITEPAMWAGMILVASPNAERWTKGLDGKKYPPVLFVHGRKDEQFDYEVTVHNVQFMKSLGFDVSLIDWPDGAHEHKEEWNQAIFDWMDNKKGTG